MINGQRTTDNGQRTNLVRQLGVLFEGGAAAGLSDRQLLERFVTSHDQAGEAAFAALVARHGPMVLGICRQLLGDHQHAEDAFQAVFLVLARKARSLREPELLGNWLYGVALRTARKARGRLARRRRTEVEGSARYSAMPAAASADRELLDSEQAEVLHGEIDRLPRAFRLPVVLYYFEGLSHIEAAHRLRWPVGTLRSRLARARDKLRAGLARRGVTLPAAALAAVLAPRSASASVSSLLCDSTTRAAIAFAARHAAASGALSASTAALAQEILKSMLIHKLRLTATSLLLLAAVATGAGWLARSLAMPEDPAQQPAAPVAKVAPRGADQPTPDPAATALMTVAGRVLDPDGKPVKGAIVEVVAQLRSPWVGASEETFGSEHALLGQVRSDGDGRFRLDATRMASVRVIQIHAMAVAPGYGLGWATLNPYVDQPAADIRLLPEQPIRIRLVDMIGRPADGVEVRVRNLARRDDQGTDGDVWFWDNPPRESRIWPRPVKTDEQGRLTLPGLGRGVNVNLGVRDLRYAHQELDLDSSKLTSSKETTLALQPARLIEGHVLAADTGQPIPNAVVSATTFVEKEGVRGYFTTKFRADDQGRFVINPIVGESYTLGAFPTGGEPYLIQQDEFPWPRGAVKATHDIKLPRGVLVRGKVTEQTTGRPLAASSIQFIPVDLGKDLLWGWQAIVASQDDGSFQIAVPPRKGHLLVFGPTGDYVLSEIGFNKLSNDRPGGTRYYAHAIIPYEARAGDPPHEVSAALRTGVTIKGRVLGPEGQTVTDGIVLTKLRIEPWSPYWRGESVPIRDGRFELHGLDPQGSSRIHLLDAEHKWGASVEVSGKQAGEDITIRLEPCGKAKARFVGPDGQPAAGLKLIGYVELLMTPGPSVMSRVDPDQAKLAADAALLANVDRKHYRYGTRTDAEGRITLISLIPGAPYRITDFSTANAVRKDFTVKPGETIDLGDIVTQKP